MKCITYVSKVVARQNGALIPVGLSNILRIARRKNAELGITGVMSYRKGHYIQVLEGDDSAVDQLYSTIKLDSRHEQITLLFEFPITDRAFSGWSMKLADSINKDIDFLSFINANIMHTSKLSSTSRAILDRFYQSNRANKVNSAQKYEGKGVKLSGWPDFASVQPTPVVVELCARLTKKAHSYNSLLDGNEFGTKNQLDKILDTFDSHDILVLTDNALDSISTSSPNKSNNFYSKMQN